MFTWKMVCYTKFSNLPTSKMIPWFFGCFSWKDNESKVEPFTGCFVVISMTKPSTSLSKEIYFLFSIETFAGSGKIIHITADMIQKCWFRKVTKKEIGYVLNSLQLRRPSLNQHWYKLGIILITEMKRCVALFTAPGQMICSRRGLVTIRSVTCASHEYPSTQLEVV